MNAIPQPNTANIVERINALQAASPQYINASEVSWLVRDWRAIGREIEALLKVDACAAWEMRGAWHCLAGDQESMEAACRNSVALGDSGSNRENWLVNRLNLGLFSAAHALYAEIGSPEEGRFTLLLSDGYHAGAVTQTASFIGEANKMHIELNEAQVQQMALAHDILRDAGVSDQHIARQLDAAGEVLRRYRLRPLILPCVTSAEGFFRGVTYSLAVPVSAEEAFEMNVELAKEEDKAGVVKNVAFDVVFEAVYQPVHEAEAA